MTGQLNEDTLDVELKIQPFITNTAPRGQIVLNKDNFVELMRQRRWRNMADVARALGYTRQNIHYVMQGGPVSVGLIARVAIVTATDIDKTYSHFFDVVKLYDKPDNHPKHNEDKYQKIIPYDKYSIAAHHRALDGDVERTGRDEILTKKP